MARSLLVLSGGDPYETGPSGELLAALGDWLIAHLIHALMFNAMPGNVRRMLAQALGYTSGGTA